MPATTEAIRVLFLSMNTSSYGVMLSDFEQWIKGEYVIATCVCRWGEEGDAISMEREGRRGVGGIEGVLFNHHV